jgi:predicted AAA+ superfamily ATPase
VGEGPRLENLVACALLKEVQWIEDSQGIDARLHYLRTRDGQEVDFVIVINDEPLLCIEIKTSDVHISPHLRFFKQQYPTMKAVQLVFDPVREFDTPDGIYVRNLSHFLAHFSLMDWITTDVIHP